MNIKTFFDARTNTLTYVVYDAQTQDAIVIDPVLDYEPAASKTWTESVDVVLEFIEAQGLKLHYIFETHAHADHLSGSQIIKRRHPEAVVAIAEKITEVQKVFKTVFDLPRDFPIDGRQFDKLLGDGEVVRAGSLEVKTIFTPGHTPACASFQIEDALFVGDVLFMPDSGTGRCDFPAGSAEDLFRSVKERIYTLGDDTRLFIGHDYQPEGRELRYETTVGQEKAGNIHLTETTTLDEYVAFRTARDETLSAPRLLFQSVQINVDAGHLPQPHDNEIRYLRIPMNVFHPEPRTGAEIELRDV